MKRLTALIAVLFVAVPLCHQARAQANTLNHETAPPASTAEPAPDLPGEVAALKRRVAELESQNREMLQLLKAVKAKLEANAETAELPRPVKASLPAAISITPEERSLPQADKAKTAKAASANNSEVVGWNELISAGNKLRLYGFLRVDLDVDSQRPNNAQSPTFITSADSRIGKPDAGSFTIYPRVTRLGLDYTGPRVAALKDAKLSGKLEIDFNNGGLESRQIIRIRHAYFKMD